MLKLHETAAGYIEQRYPGTEVTTAWPLSAELSRPEFGYVRAAHRVRDVRDFGESTLEGLAPGAVDLFVLYSRQWDPPGNLLRNAIVMKFWRRFFSYQPQISSFDLDTKFHLKTVAAWTQRGQWIEINARY